MKKKDDSSYEVAPGNLNETLRAMIKSIKSPIDVTDKKHRPKRHKKAVKFAEPLAEQRLYDKTVSPNAEPRDVVIDNSNKTAAASALSDLGPPLSLVAHLDLAAKKLKARPVVTIKAVDDLATKTVDKSIKSIKSMKSVKSVVRDTKDMVKKDKH